MGVSIYYIVFAVVVVGIIAYYIFKERYENKTPWQHFFDDAAFSATEFYDQVQAGIANRKFPYVDFAEETFRESHVLSGRRAYLRITWGEYVYYICVAPFGTGTFVSEWLCVKKLGVLNKIPLLNKLLGKDRDNKTFYQVDTEAMYRSAIHTAVLEVIEGIGKVNGMRGLTELEKQYPNS